MKAFFSRHFGNSGKERDSGAPREKLPPLRPWPPEEPQRQTATPTSYTSFKPLPEVVPEEIADQLAPAQRPRNDPSPSPTPTPTPPEGSEDTVPDLPAGLPRHEQESTGRSSRKTLNGSIASSDVHKKVAFISPPPTPAGLDRVPSEPTTPTLTASSPLPAKTTVSRFQAAHGEKPRASTGASSSRTDVGSTKASAKASVRTTSPSMQGSAASLRSGTPVSTAPSDGSSRILSAQSWSEVTEDDLVSNLGSRERTRQEVLFEIISSEERYVQELIKMKETFIDPLLHPFSASATPVSSTPNLDYDYLRSESPLSSSNDHLPPIAARFMSPTPPSVTPPTQHVDADTLDTDEEDEHDDQLGRSYRRPGGAMSQAARLNHPRSPYRATVTKNAGGKGGTAPGHRTKGLIPRTGAFWVLRKLKKSQGSEGQANVLGDSIAPHQLPEDLRVCLEVIDGGVLDGHKRLCEALKKRYEDQYPLVRSLADVFVSNSDIFQGYARYVLHLERALEQVDDALSNVNNTKKPKKQDAHEWQKVCKAFQKLEEIATDKGETGLAITLSKPFQRLLKYPLLFQNLLFHTDPSTFEYESTLQMVAEVEQIVRSIEDEKIQKEERDKTRDVFARIEGLEKVRQLAQPKPSRILVEERQCAPTLGSIGPGGYGSPTPPPTMINGKNVRGKSSFKRLSDVLNPNSGRTGTTSLPLVAHTASRTNSLPEFQGKAKYATTGRRNSTTRPRNLYKFLKIETWDIGEVMQPREGVVSMDDVARSKAQKHNSNMLSPTPTNEDDPGMESDDSDRKSKMSFSYWGADKITVQKPINKMGRVTVPRRGGVPGGVSYGRESSANAKFGTRLVSGDSTQQPLRPGSRRTTTTPTSRRAQQSEEGHGSKATIAARPAWNSPTSPLSTPPTNARRPRNVSQTSTPATAARPAAKAMQSPAPSEDSGVGLYRQIVRNDPTLKNV
ncbi:hypothetical protein BD626DRAFT_570622 [Schizophyllum amplum]|uniref:DH domain-containing protein n=1 Tax=Schizophyllum amplum TaxID=97359 RepID=A0A550CAU2_9AGAR|nr:hypothetical protein BD626DRAFT_570622 [Auriculariopsis ampla]